MAFATPDDGTGTEVGFDQAAAAVVGQDGAAVVDLTGEEPVLQVVDELPPASEVSAEIAPGLLHAARWQLALKRALDIVISLLALILLLPVLLAVAVAIKLTSRGPVLFVQERIGWRGEPFKMAKFRSMYHGAEAERQLLAALNEQAGPVFKIRDDPRITPLGRILRRLSIDELPQLLNVLKGDMSLVGPRPPLPEECAVYTDRERGRLAVRPGLTCIWQISGRSDIDFDAWVDMDLEYIRSWRLSSDLKILLLTVPAVLTARGAW